MAVIASHSDWNLALRDGLWDGALPEFFPLPSSRFPAGAAVSFPGSGGGCGLSRKLPLRLKMALFALTLG